MYVIQASPLTKMFMPEWEQKCLEQPELIGSSVPFTVRVPRATGGIVLEHNKPVHVSKLIPPNPNRKVEVDEVKDLIPWLCGGDDRPSDETDIYGIVVLDIDMAVTHTISSMLGDPELLSPDEKVREAAMRRQIDQQRTIQAAISAKMEAARERANARVKRALKITHANLIRQWEQNVANGKGKYPPSAAEALGAFVLAEEIKKASDAKQKLMENMTNIMQRTQLG